MTPGKRPSREGFGFHLDHVPYRVRELCCLFNALFKEGYPRTTPANGAHVGILMRPLADLVLVLDIRDFFAADPVLVPDSRPDFFSAALINFWDFGNFFKETGL